jgi:transcriptional regulator with XRE-family HTH domain
MVEVRTLKELRELRGFSRDELAEMIRVDPEDLARWEEVGLPVYLGTKDDALFAFYVFPRLVDALNAYDNVIEAVEAPTEARPGDLVLSLGALLQIDPDTSCFLADHAKEINLRVAVPNRWDIALKRLENVVPKDWEAIVSALKQDSISERNPAEHLGETAALFQEHSTNDDDWLDDVLEWRGGKWRPKKPKAE